MASAALKALSATDNINQLPKLPLPKDSEDCTAIALERLKQLSGRSVPQISPSAFSKMKMKELPRPTSEATDPSPLSRKRARHKSPDFPTSSPEKKTPSTSQETIVQDQSSDSPIYYSAKDMIEAIKAQGPFKDSCKQIIRKTAINLLEIRYYLSELLKYPDENGLPTFHESNLTLITTIGSIPPGPEHDEELINAIAACKAYLSFR